METTLTDTEFLAAFESATLPRPLWTHAAHIRMAYLCLRDRSPGEATPIIRAGIRRYNEANGNVTGYNECLTLAFIRIVAGRLAEKPSTTFDDFRAENPDLFEKGISVLLDFYSYPVWKEAEAKHRFIEPDQAPLP